MTEVTQSEGPTHAPSAYGWCAWHQGFADGVRLINAIEQGSGPHPGGNHFACLSCRQAYDLLPLADQP